MTGFFRDRVLSLALAWTINSLAYSIVYPFIPIYLNKQRGVPYSTVGVIYPLMSGAIILAPMIVGPLIDRIGCRFALQFGQSGRGLVFLLLALMAFCHAPFWFFAAVLALNPLDYEEGYSRDTVLEAQEIIRREDTQKGKL